MSISYHSPSAFGHTNVVLPQRNIDMTKLANFVLSFAVTGTSEMSLVELVKNLLTSSTYRHTEKRSSVVSVRSETVRLIGRLFKAHSETFETYAQFVSALVSGNIHIPSDDLNAFIIRVCRTVGYRDLPKQSDVVDVLQICFEDYIESNPFLSVEMLAGESRIAKAESAKA